MLKRPVRVVHIISGDNWAGAEVMAWTLLTHLKAGGGCAVAAICLNEGTLARRLSEAGVIVHVLPEATVPFRAIVKAATKVALDHGADVLHSHRYKEHLLAALVAGRTGSRLVATVHGLPEPGRTRRFRYRAQLWAGFRLLRHRFDAVTAVSEQLRRSLGDEYGLRAPQLNVIVNGIARPGPRARERSGGAALQVGSVGRLVPVKRFDMFLEVAAILRRRFADARFSILGDGPDGQRLIARAAALGLAGVFTLVAPLTDPWPYYESLDVYLNTSESEGLPLSVLEAMAAGVPVVASNVGGLPEVIRDGIDGFLVPPSDARRYADAGARLLADADYRRRMGGHASSRVNAAFSAERMAEQYQAMYGAVAGPVMEQRAS